MSNVVHADLMRVVVENPPRPPARKPKLTQQPNPNSEPLTILDPPVETACDEKRLHATVVITIIILGVIGGLAAMGLTGQFTSDGWICKVAFPAMKSGFEKAWHWIVHTAIPAIRKFLDMKANLSVGQGLLYIGLPIVGTGLLGTLGYKLGSKYVPIVKEQLNAKWADYEAEKEDLARIKGILAEQEDLIDQEKENEELRIRIAARKARGERRPTIRKPIAPPPDIYENLVSGWSTMLRTPEYIQY